jgi:hypothetical protein
MNRVRIGGVMGCNHYSRSGPNVVCRGAKATPHQLSFAVFRRYPCYDYLTVGRVCRIISSGNSEL